MKSQRGSDPGGSIYTAVINRSGTQRLELKCGGHLQLVSINCKAMGKLYNCFKFHFLICKIGIIIFITRVVTRIKLGSAPISFGHLK